MSMPKLSSSGACVEEPEALVEEPGARVEEPGARVEEPGALVEEPGARVEEPGARVEEPEALVEEPGARVEEPEARVEEPGARVEEPGARVEEPGARVKEPEARVEEPGEGSAGPRARGAVDAQLQEAVRLKMEGNAFYREKKVRSAIGRYHRSLLVLRGLDSDVTSAVKGFGPAAPVLTARQEELLRSTQVDCYNNLAACLLQKQRVDYTRVQEYSLRVLQWRPADTKALYRAGVATLELGDALSARQYLTQASRGQPNDANVRKHLQRVEERLSSEYQKEKALYRGMFPSPGAGEGPSQVSPK